MEVITWAGLLALTGKLVSVLKAVGKDNNMALTQVLVWAVGVGVAFVAANADVASHLMVIGNTPLGQLDGWSLVLAGMMGGSTISQVYDFKKARDNTDSASEPPLLPPVAG